MLTTLASLEESVRNAGLVTPALVLMGEVVSRKPAVSWFEARPLLGLRVLVTRPRQQSATMVRELELLGAVPFMLPALTITAPADWTRVDQAIERLSEYGYDWLAFTSSNGVEAFFRRIRQQGKDLRVLGCVKLAVIGKVTADALRRYHLEPDCVPTEDMRSEMLAAQLKELVAGKRILLAQAEQGRPLLGQQLSEVASVDSIGVYSQDDRLDPKGEIFDHLRRGEINVVTLTSPNIAHIPTGVRRHHSKPYLTLSDRGDYEQSAGEPGGCRVESAGSLSGFGSDDGRHHRLPVTACETHEGCET